MECPRCAEQNWYKVTKEIHNSDNAIIRRLLCRTCGLLVISEETTDTDNKIDGVVYGTRHNISHNIRWKQLKNIRYKTKERIISVLVYDKSTNKEQQIPASDYKFDFHSEMYNKKHRLN